LKDNSEKLTTCHSASSGPQSAHWPKKTFATISTMLFDCWTVVRQEQGSDFCGTMLKAFFPRTGTALDKRSGHDMSCPSTLHERREHKRRKLGHTALHGDAILVSARIGTNRVESE
jgi:hypothetical protein